MTAPTGPAAPTDPAGPPAPSGPAAGDGSPPAPVVRVDHGNPSAEDLAVLVALLAGVGGGSPEPGRPTSRWSAPDVRLRNAGPGRGAWRFSGMPV